MAISDRIRPLSKALVELKLDYDEALERHHQTPFFFVVGSGISFPSIPTASQIIEHCRTRARERNPDVDEPKNDSPAYLYSYWFAQAYRHPIDRQKYLHGLIRDARVTPATLSLAHLLIDGSLAKLVVTPNFDDLVLRSLLLLGQRPLVSDHRYTASRMDPDSNEIQIVHVHGSHHFYDLANLDAEIDDRSKIDIKSPTAIPEFLMDLLRARSPIVIGYSGWDDVIMKTLFRRLNGRTPPRNIYWFCYDEREIDRLPEWLTSSQYVYFVTGREPGTKGAETSVKPAETDQKDAAAARGAGGPALLPASSVLRDLVTKLKLDTPRLAKSPLDFLYAEIEAAVGTLTPGDEHYFSDVLRRLDRARKYEEREGAKAAADKVFASFADAAWRAANTEIVTLANALAREALTIEQLRMVASTIETTAGSALLGKEERAMALLALDTVMGRIADKTKLIGDSRAWLKKRIAVALELYELGMPDDELRLYSEIEERFATSDDERVRALVIEAAGYKANTLSEDRERHADALELVESVHARYEKDRSEVVQDALAELALSRALVLDRSGPTGAVALTEVFERYRFAKSVKQLSVAAAALSHRAQLAYLAKSDQTDEAERAELAIRDEIVEFTAELEGLRLERLRNFREIAATLSLANPPDHTGAIQTADRALQELGTTGDDPDLELIRAQLLRWKTRSQFGAGQRDEGMQSARELIDMRSRTWKGLFEVVAHGYRYLFNAYLDPKADDRAAAAQLVGALKKERAEAPLLDAEYEELISSLETALTTSDERRREPASEAG